ncbi:unnamed protein product [Adineta ricciae]|uniref:NAD(P)(+)--arginine ADP-ribosyltransferase n=1 Tax=Adineta ricciae TaxID=249248 RepID=A0A815F4Z4_ADIRI|nr:unnamed protein product [Adineta ricciae]
MASKFTSDDIVPHQRFTDVKYENNEFLLPIDGYQKVDLVSLEEAMKPIEKYVDRSIQEKVYIAKKRCKNPKDNLTQDESASIQIYTMESTEHEQSLYYNVNKTLRKEDRRQLVPYFPYLKLILTALWKLPAFNGRVWRGVNGDLSKKFEEGDSLVWWGFSSCTRHLNVLESQEFLGKEGTRTLFTIECSNGKLIKDHSYFAHEDEVLLLPGVELRVAGKVRPAPGLTIIELKEVTDGPVVLLKPPFTHDNSQRHIESTGYASEEVQRLVQQLKSSDKEFENGWLSLETANLSLADGKAIVKALETNTNVEKFSIESQNISMECLDYLVDSIKINTRIRCLYFIGKDDDDNDGSYLVPVCTRTLINTLNINKTITRLEMSRTTITDHDIKMITDMLKRNSRIDGLYIYRNPYLTVQSALYVSELLKVTSTITSLSFYGKPNINDECAIPIASALKINSTVDDLIMFHSQISDRGARALGEMLSQNHTLTSLSLNANQITDAGAKALAEGLKRNSTLRFLHVKDNHFTKESTGGKALQAAKSSKLTIFFG